MAQVIQTQATWRAQATDGEAYGGADAVILIDEDHFLTVFGKRPIDGLNLAQQVADEHNELQALRERLGVEAFGIISGEAVLRAAPDLMGVVPPEALTTTWLFRVEIDDKLKAGSLTLDIPRP